MKKQKSDYFATSYGCEALQFFTNESLHDILYHILKDGGISIKGLPDVTLRKPERRTGFNILSILIRSRKIDLYNLLLNRLLLSSPHMATSFLSVVHTLLRLQENDQRGEFFL